MTIEIRSFTNKALSAEDGITLRNLIKENINKEEKIILDFKDIKLFSTMFFNASLGFFIKEGYDYSKLLKMIGLKNITDLGKNTFAHSLSNSLFVSENKDLNIYDIINDTIEKE